MIAHRGASAYSPENTLAAFRLAADQRADAIELDAKRTLDGAVVAHHDHRLGRTVAGSGALGEYTLAQLQALDAGSHFSPQYAGERIPTLEEILQAVAGRVLVNIELTNYHTPRDDLPERVVSAVRALGFEKRVLLSSFNPIALSRARRLAPDIPAGLLVYPRESRLVRALLQRLVQHEAFHPHDEITTRRVISQARRKGKLVFVWTVNDPQRMRDLASWGADGLITDRPDLARKVLLIEAL